MSTLLVWSGGLDSTAILLKYLDENKHFETVYFDLENNKHKSKQEILARKKILKFIEKEYRYIIKDTIVKISEIRHWGNLVVYTQPNIWINNILWILQDYMTEVSFGYIKEDDFWHIKHDFEKFFLYGLKIVNPEIKDNEIPKLVYPLEWETKEDIIKNIYINNKKKVLEMIWICEDPKENKECGKCLPCKKFKKLRK